MFLESALPAAENSLWSVVFAVLPQARGTVPEREGNGCKARRYYLVQLPDLTAQSVFVRKVLDYRVAVDFDALDGRLNVAVPEWCTDHRNVCRR